MSTKIKTIIFYKILFDVGFVGGPRDILSIVLNKSTYYLIWIFYVCYASVSRW